MAGPIGAKFGMRHQPDASQVLRDFGGATPRDGEIIAKNEPIMSKFGARMGPKYQIKCANSGKTMRRSVSPSKVCKISSKSPIECHWSQGATPRDGEIIAQNVRVPPPFHAQRIGLLSIFGLGFL